MGISSPAGVAAPEPAISTFVASSGKGILAAIATVGGALNMRFSIGSAIVFRTFRAVRSFLSSDLAAGGVDVGDNIATRT